MKGHLEYSENTSESLVHGSHSGSQRALYPCAQLSAFDFWICVYSSLFLTRRGAMEMNERKKMYHSVALKVKQNKCVLVI